MFNFKVQKVHALRGAVPCFVLFCFFLLMSDIEHRLRSCFSLKSYICVLQYTNKYVGLLTQWWLNKLHKNASEFHGDNCFKIIWIYCPSNWGHYPWLFLPPLKHVSVSSQFEYIVQMKRVRWEREKSSDIILAYNGKYVDNVCMERERPTVRSFVTVARLHESSLQSYNRHRL